MGTIAGCARRYGDPFTLPSPGGSLVTTGDPEAIRAIFSAPPDEHKAARRLRGIPMVVEARS